MTSQTSSHAGAAELKDASATLKSLVEQPPSNTWIPLAFGVLFLLTGTVIVTNTGERFTLDD